MKVILWFLSSKIKDILTENNINTIEELIANKDDISELKGGPKSLEKIKEKISENEQAKRIYQILNNISHSDIIDFLEGIGRVAMVICLG